MANENQKMQVLDAHGLDLFAGRLKDGTLVVGKANSVDASGINGMIPLNKIPAAALERIIVVADNDALLALTAEDVQNGDTIKVNDEGKMYFVADDSKLGTEEAFIEFVVGTAAKAALADAVPWSGITDKPEAFTPAAHAHTPAECGIEPIPDETIEAIISGTWTPND
ncbi:hypothetical protein [uncultured Duncaniella sp.]|uniref:hypothetical protein n=1 Tax=uncultured Duncaniella sp. TaxID=2768039 RepID=UPI0026F3AA93|nr:hypothetical protein [uncultured Duncaniella sp.]